MFKRNYFLLGFFLCFFQTVFAQENPPYHTKSIVEEYEIFKPYRVYSQKDSKPTPKVKVKIKEVFYTSNKNQLIYKTVASNSYSTVDKFWLSAGGQTIKEPFVTNYENDEYFQNGIKLHVHGLRAVPRIDYTTEVKKTYHDAKYLTKVDFFSAESPCEKKTIEFKIPKDIEVDLIELNFENYHITKTVKEQYLSNIHSYTLTSIPIQDKSSFQPPANTYQPHILVIVKSYMEGKERISAFENTQQLYNWYHQLSSSVENDNTELVQLVDKLTAGLSSDEEKIKAIYYWVQDNIQYIAFEEGLAGFKPDNCQNVFDKRYGDCKGMANLTAEMLKISGFDARLCWLGTKSIPYDYSIPSLAVDNHMITALFHKGEIIYLDATEKYIGYKMYADRIQGRPTMIENGDDFILGEIPGINAANNRVVHVDSIAIDLDQKMVIGKKAIVANGEEKTLLHNLFHRTPSQNLDEMLRSIYKKNDNYYVSNLEHQNFDNREKAVHINYDYKAKFQSIHNKNSIYLNMDFNPYFKSVKNKKHRKIAWVFSEQMDRKNTVYLEIPENYSLAYAPEDFSVKHQFFNIDISFEQKGNTLIYKKEIVLPTGHIPEGYTAEWHEVLSQIQKIYNDHIRLDIEL